MNGLRAWFSSRSLREKRLLLVMAALMALTVIWAGIIRPVGDGLSTSRERYSGAVDRLAATEVRVEAVRGAQARRPPPLTGTLADVVRGAAQNAGFTLAGLDEPAAGEVHVTIQSARPAALSGWLARLEQSGVLVDSARLTDNGDRTVAADLTFRARVT